jgi:hypothetical protein
LSARFPRSTPRWNTARKQDGNAALRDTLGFGNCNAVLGFKQHMNQPPLQPHFLNNLKERLNNE